MPGGDVIERTWSLGTCPECGAQTLHTTELYAVHLARLGVYDSEETAVGRRYTAQCGNPSCDYGDAEDEGI